MAIVEVQSGKVEGRESEKGLSFLGIPYAAPPVGPLRFRPPQPAPPWDGTLQAKEYGPAAPQDPAEPGLPFMPMAPGRTDEDCLYLNVWTPAVDSGRRPVLLWVHGGGLYAGSASEPFYSGEALAAEQDVVVVSVNYRLGALGGFVYLNELGDERLAQSANAGLLDLVLALEWVRDNIGCFGGDPGCVTVAGESAGGGAVGTLLGMPQTRGLLHRAILQSPATPNVYSPQEAGVLTDAFLANLGTTDPAGILSADAARLVRAVTPMVQTMTMGPFGTPIGPSLDGTVITRQPLERLQAGEAAGIPLMVGTNTHELELLLRGPGLDKAGDDALAMVVQLFPEEQPDGSPWRSRLQEAYSTAALAHADPAPPMPVVMLFNDRMIRIDAIRTLEAQVAAQPRCFAYLLELPTQVDAGAPHAVDTVLLFDTASLPQLPELLGTGDEIAAAGRALRDRWAAFMRTGEPAVQGAPAWPAYDTRARTTMVLGPATRVVEDPWAAQRRAWDGIATPGGPLPVEASSTA
ncbi:MAG: hypothetical protein JWR63_1431 [Conexibacter sp.]|nr:hypothetical protein [Conexibacter sp.]